MGSSNSRQKKNYQQRKKKTMEGIQQYQRAVTPTMSNSTVENNQIRGKMLSYSGGGGTKKSNDYVLRNSQQGRGSRNSLKSLQGHPLEISGQSKPVSSVRNGLGIGSNGIPRHNSDYGNNRSPLINSTQIDSDSSSSSHHLRENKASFLLPRHDLEPLTEEIPSDGIIFCHLRSHRLQDSSSSSSSSSPPLVVYRLHEERLRNPERLNLDRRHLDQCPYLEQEQRLRLLNYQNNQIRQIQNLENLTNLIFLDLYNNKLSSLEGCLSITKGLRVLMVGKNQINELNYLNHLKKLDVLDLHSNQIKEIKTSSLEGLNDLRVLNLAGNMISLVHNLLTLNSLTELNLRRNCIEMLVELDCLPSLQRIFLSHNLIEHEQKIHCLFQIKSLIELSLDSNPIAERDPIEYRLMMIGRIPR
jgi:Leucine-rich repeat (LRR) protein